jgi:hypothetical protein
MNEPVAWMQTWENQDGELKRTVNIEQIGKQDIPLYTGFKELTDEEIEEIAEEFKDVDYTLNDEEAFDVFNHRGFARAIMKRAQE